MQIPEIQAVFSMLPGGDPISIERIGGGRNSKVWRVTCRDSRQYAAKLYFRDAQDSRDRLEVEYSSLQFLWDHGVRCIPQPILADREQGYAIYEYVVGEKISSRGVTESDVDCAVGFLAGLKELKNKRGSSCLRPASEACFSVSAIVASIDTRLSKLDALRNGGERYSALREYLDRDFKPAFGAIREWCMTRLGQSGGSYDSDLPLEERTLSPSDFGFHNALRRGDGQIVFLDFEYFGWDDPAKMVVDVLLHPGMELSRDLKRRFASGILRSFGEYPKLAARIEIVYPLFGLKWCLILLNEFLPEQLLRRRFALPDSLPRGDTQRNQLVKARRMLGIVMEEYERFPYFDGRITD